jgi:DNA (cytosine-5)-methyltransferase 1
MPRVPALTAVDLFSGAGGTTQGLREAGYEVVSAVEFDQDAAGSYRANHADTDLLARPIQHVQAPALARRLCEDGTAVDLVTACPPCQPFSTLGTGDTADPRNALVSSVQRFVTHLQPRAVVLENVPGVWREPRFVRLVDDLRERYDMREYVVQATDFGVPQRRRRMIVLGIDREFGTPSPADLVAALPDDFDATSRTAGEALALARDLTETVDPVHRARRPRAKTLQRMLAVKQGGGRRQLPEHLQLACHQKLDSQDATSIYGRIDPTKPSPTMTTRCTTPSCGRFVHPTENRGLTLREAALLQTFPVDYQFVGGHDSIERQIGNAVPPRLAEAIGLIVRELIEGAAAPAVGAQAT